MTVAELKLLIEDLPDDMDVFMPFGEDDLITVCYVKSDVVEIDLEEVEKKKILILQPCDCEIEYNENEGKPNLN